MADARAMRRRLQVIFLGPPGAGKGTQASLLAEHLRIPEISTGDILRDAIAQGTELGRQVAPIMEQGKLVPDELLMGIVQERIHRSDCDGGYILDGFPRTLAQAKGLELLNREGDSHLVASVAVPRGELLKRLSGRRWCPSCQATYHVDANPPQKPDVCDKDGVTLLQREDDKEATVTQRLMEYERRTAPLIDHYRGLGRLHEIDGHRPVSAVFSDLRRLVEEHL